jgi:hypothetical protein
MSADRPILIRTQVVLRINIALAAPQARQDGSGLQHLALESFLIGKQSWLLNPLSL